jgi:hypothetical protein
VTAKKEGRVDIQTEFEYGPPGGFELRGPAKFNDSMYSRREQ